MNRKIASALLATILATSSTYVLAQPGPPGQQHGNGPSGPPGHGPSDSSGHGPSNGPSGHGPSNQPDRGKGGPPPGHAKGGHDKPAAYRPDPPPARWSKGQRVPDPYRGPQYVIDDWRPYHLHQPPRGYHWISVGADFFLVSIGSGVVLEAVLGN